MKMQTVGPMKDGKRLERELEIAVSRLGEKPKFAIVYTPFGITHHPVLREVGKVVDGPVIGATTGGGVFTGVGYLREGIGVALFAGDDLSVDVAFAGQIEHDPETKVRECHARLKYDNSKRGQTLFVLADPFAWDGDLMAQRLGVIAGPARRVFGGMAGDDFRFKDGGKVFYDGNAHSRAVVMAAICTDERPAMAARHGWCAFERSRPHTVTKVDGTRLIELDDRPAFEVYVEELEHLGLHKQWQDIEKSLGTYALGINTPFGEGLSIRACMGVDERKNIIMSGALAERDTVRVAGATSEQMLDAAQRVIEEVRHEKDVKNVVIVDCSARWAMLGTRYREEVDIFRGKGSEAMIGFASYGEIAKYGGTVRSFNNTTSVVVGW